MEKREGKWMKKPKQKALDFMDCEIAENMSNQTMGHVDQGMEK